MKMRRLMIMVLLTCTGSRCADSHDAPPKTGTASAPSVTHVDISLQRDHRRRPGMACADSIRPFLKNAMSAEGFVLTGWPRQREEDVNFESYVIRKPVGLLVDSDRDAFVGILSDSSSYCEYVKLGMMSPTFGLRFISKLDTLTALFTFGQENHWCFRHGGNSYVGHFDSIATEVRKLVARVAPDADVR